MGELARLTQVAEGLLDVMALDPYQRAYYKAKTSQDAESFRVLTRIAHAKLGTRITSSRGIEKMCRNHFGASISFVSIRTDLRCTNDKVREYQQVVKESMIEVRESLKKALESLAANR